MRSAYKSTIRNAGFFGIGLLSTAAGAALAWRRRHRHHFRGKVVLITGGSRGLGLALAEELGRRGARLVLAARDAGELERARTLLLSRGAVRNETDILVESADLRQAGEAQRLVQHATTHFGRIDILINNAGVITVGPIEHQTVDTFRDVMDTNFFSGVHCTLAVLPQMLARGNGAIANISSVGGKIAVPHLLPYSASKFAIVGFSEGLGAELAPKGIHVTTVCPGLMRTGSHLHAIFTGNAAKEYRWFSLGASLPGAATAASCAARQIANGIASRAVDVTITPQAVVAARLGNLCPPLTRLLLRGMNALLPSAHNGETASHRGADVRQLELRSLTPLGQSAALRYNQTTPAEN